jgi:pimeloyl-CoA synthetase
LGLYLSDQGIEFYQEAKTGNNGHVDFISANSHKSEVEFIIETKYLKVSDISGEVQLKNYLGTENKKFGFLVIYIKGEDEPNTTYEVINNETSNINSYLIDLRSGNRGEMKEPSGLKIVIKIQIKDGNIITTKTQKVNLPLTTFLDSELSSE